jgi:hypothetical protein
MGSVGRIRKIVQAVSSEQGVPFTVNVVRKNDFLSHIKGPGSPAIRRILLFKYLIPLINSKWIDRVKKVAEKNQTWFDYLVEMDFQMQMTLSNEMKRNDISRFRLRKEQLIQYFPILYMCLEADIDVGFPKKRKKLVFPPQDNLDYTKDVRK